MTDRREHNELLLNTIQELQRAVAALSVKVDQSTASLDAKIEQLTELLDVKIEKSIAPLKDRIDSLTTWMSMMKGAATLVILLGIDRVKKMF